MKKTIIAFAVMALMAGVSSCAKCITCKKGDEKLKACDKDWNGGDQGDQIEYFEALGWECKKSSDSY